MERTLIATNNNLQIFYKGTLYPEIQNIIAEDNQRAVSNYVHKVLKSARERNKIVEEIYFQKKLYPFTQLS
jgi:hypothetical protein